MECKPPSKVFTVDAVCTTPTFVLSTNTPGSPRKARGLPSFIHMISIMLMNVLFHYFAWHWVRPVGPGARRLILCSASCSRTSSVLALKPSPAKAAARGATVRQAGVKGRKGCPHEKWLRTKKHVHSSSRLPASPAGCRAAG